MSRRVNQTLTGDTMTFVTCLINCGWLGVGVIGVCGCVCMLSLRLVAYFNIDVLFSSGRFFVCFCLFVCFLLLLLFVCLF